NEDFFKKIDNEEFVSTEKMEEFVSTEKMEEFVSTVDNEEFFSTVDNDIATKIQQIEEINPVDTFDKQQKVDLDKSLKPNLERSFSKASKEGDTEIPLSSMNEGLKEDKKVEEVLGKKLEEDSKCRDQEVNEQFIINEKIVHECNVKNKYSGSLKKDNGNCTTNFLDFGNISVLDYTLCSCIIFAIIYSAYLVIYKILCP
ncbi:hypothetical protein NGRA_2988, partial [Nosema granulosis]